MKYLYLALIVLMSVSVQKEYPMSYADQVRARQANAEANYQARQGNADDAMRGRGTNRATETPAWGNKLTGVGSATGGQKSLWLRAMESIGGGRPTVTTPTNWQPSEAPSFAPQNYFANPARTAAGDRRDLYVAPRAEVGTSYNQPQETPAPALSLPAWLTTPAINQPASRFNPTGLQPSQIKAEPKDKPARASSVSMNENVSGYEAPALPLYPTGSFFASGGEQVAGPATVPTTVAYPGDTGGYGGFGTNYGWGGGGRGWGKGWGSSGGRWNPEMGLFNWNYKGYKGRQNAVPDLH